MHRHHGHGREIWQQQGNNDKFSITLPLTGSLDFWDQVSDTGCKSAFFDFAHYTLQAYKGGNCLGSCFCSAIQSLLVPERSLKGVLVGTKPCQRWGVKGCFIQCSLAFAGRNCLGSYCCFGIVPEAPKERQWEVFQLLVWACKTYDIGYFTVLSGWAS